jgi:hypothetical protein
VAGRLYLPDKVSLIQKISNKQNNSMLKRFIFPLLLLMISCNAPNPPANTAKPKSHAKPKAVAPKPAPNPWVVKNYTDASGQSTERKYARLDTEGTFTSSSVTSGHLFVTIMLNKENAGILLRQSGKSNPVEKATGVVRIKLRNQAGKEVELSSSRGWNKSGGILIEQNNNDYSQFRIFMLQSEGAVSAEIRDESSSAYYFDISATGFGDSLNQL